jgi:hypothetical protein
MDRSVKFSLCLIKHYVMTTYKGEEAELHVFLILSLAGSSRFDPAERSTGTHWIGGWVASRAGLDAMEREKKHLSLAGNLTPAVQPIARRCID